MPSHHARAQELETACLLLRTGDFIDGSFKGIEKMQVSVSSVIFGLRRLSADREAVAVVIQKVDKKKGE